MTETKRQCIKCGSLLITIEWEQYDDELSCECEVCGYYWTETPLDRLKPLESLGTKLEE